MSANKKNPVIIPCDLGWGFCKYGRMNNDGQMSYHSFPSLAPRASSQDMSNMAGRRDTVIVSVDDTLYEVGPDSGDLENNDSTRSLNDNYIFTEQYKAVFYGALSYIGEEEIDMLVVGLPVSGMNLTDQLIGLMKGKHKINNDVTVTVKDVLVMPQPLGGIYYCMANEGLHEDFKYLKEDCNLLIDPGFLTYDFLVTYGDRPIENRSSAHNGGVSKILRSIANSISEKFGIKYENLGAIDRGLVRKKMKINGKKEDLLEHIKNTKSVIEGSVNYMKNMVGDGSDIDNIILFGGGADIFKKTIENYYSNHEIIVLEDSQYVVVKGFREAGLRAYEKKAS